MACLSYEGLSGAVRRACKETNGDILANRVLGPDVSDHERADFHDAVSRSLRLGNFLLLGVGDGIRAGLQQIATLLQDRATLGFSLRLIEMPVFAPQANSGPYYVQPRLLLQTEVVIRNVHQPHRTPSSLEQKCPWRGLHLVCSGQLPKVHNRGTTLIA